VLTNSTAVVTFVHTISAAFLTAGAFVASVALWRLARRDADADAFRAAARIGAVTVLAGALIVLVSGDQMARLMTEQQPMKMAAAEALYSSEQPASFSLFTIGSLDGTEEVWSVRVPYLLSWLATGDPNGAVEGINDLQAGYEQQYGAGDYRPSIPIAYWTFRLMIGFGALAALVAAWMLWSTRGRRLPGRWLVRAAVLLPLAPLAANSVGWIFTEMARQPWIVFGLMPTAAGVSPGTSVAEVLITMVAFTVVYGALAVVEVRLLLGRIRRGLSNPEEPEPVAETAFGY
jgi:cytochrome d ubiquinol oxidase subunit I